MIDARAYHVRYGRTRGWGRERSRSRWRALRGYWRTWRRRSRVRPCCCDAYGFPHRAGGGLCAPNKYAAALSEHYANQG